MKLCKTCKHRKWSFTKSWRCRAGEHISNPKVTNPVTGRVGFRYSGFLGFPRCEYMRQENHSFILVQCGPEGVLWESKHPEKEEPPERHGKFEVVGTILVGDGIPVKVAKRIKPKTDWTEKE